MPLMLQWFQFSDHFKWIRPHEVMTNLVYFRCILIYWVPGMNYWVLSSVIEHQGSTASMPWWFRAPDHLKRVRPHKVMIILVYCEYILIYQVPGKNHQALSSVIEHRGLTASMPWWFRAPDHLKQLRSHQVMIILVYFQCNLIYQVPVWETYWNVVKWG